MVKMSSAIFTKSNTALPYYNNSNSNNHNKNNSNSNTTAQPQQQLSAAVKMFKYQNIAPAPTMPLSHGCAGAEIKTRKYTPRAPSNGGGPFSVDQTQSVQRRNARERNRVKQVNTSFARLRQHIPQTIITDLLKGGGRGPHKKISKVDTLRIAVEYIRRLQDLVDDLNAGSSSGGAHNKISSVRSSSSSGLLMATTSDNNTTSSNTSFSSNSSSASSNLSLLTPDSPAANAPNADGLAAAEQLYFASAANSVLQAAFHQQQQQQHHQQFNTALLTADTLQAYTSPQPQTQTSQTQLDIGCPSPTSSFNSSMSFDSGTFVHSPLPQQQLSPLQHTNAIDAQRGSSENNKASASQIDANLQLKFEPYDNFNLHEEDCTPDDEEILDYISLWQEQ